MGTRALLGLLLFLLLLQPHRAWAGSLNSPGLSECFQVNGADYRGHQNHTGPRGTGRPCLFWDQTQQHSYSSASDPQGRWGLGAHNFCRNPDGDVQPWCYVAETEEGIYWRYCDIPTCHMPGYLGCFVDSGTPPALSGPSGTSTKLTVQVCLRFCRMKGYQLAGVEAGYACFCGSESDLARGLGAPATDCDQICFGHPGQLCGGDGRLGIYEVSVGSCQGNWTAPQGVIYSPDFPDEYGPDRNCSWVVGPTGAALELTFRLFELADPRLQNVLEDRAQTKGLTQTPAETPGGANASCSPRPVTLQAAIRAPVFSSVTVVSVLLLLLLLLLRLLRRRNCLLAPGKGPPALGPSRGPGRSWAVWYRRPRGMALPRPTGDPPAEGPAMGYLPLSASSQSSLRSLISAL
ncbi:Kremen protein 2 [Fukomys damarensis]|uniref:Kringle-containing protein marking the eye and the nose n=1 Tax=Fukomys damarensis TaxID=885580 RepID=A0A091DM38_FUKDA|nr:Kremen protein 2 [Fukomys damarensis]